jgi:hypothetical protein
VLSIARLAGAALTASGLLCWPVAAVAQGVGPTPQPPSVPVNPEEAARVETETWAVHAQSTFTPMYHPGFAAAFSGAQSLDAHEQARETWDMTLYAGLRLWPGAEFWFNPEVDQGFGLSNTFGVAGYLSGEAYKVGKSDPYFLIQRTFLRQTIDLGGETEKLDPDLNQLGGTQTADRLVLTLASSRLSISSTPTNTRMTRGRIFSTGRSSIRARSIMRRMPGVTPMAALRNGIRTGGRSEPASSTCQRCRTA